MTGLHPATMAPLYCLDTADTGLSEVTLSSFSTRSTLLVREDWG